MKSIQEDIRTGTFKNQYLLYGSEDYLKKQYRDNLKKALLGSGDPMNLNVFRGKNVSIGEMIDLAETLPFFAERRIIILENTGLFKKDGEKLAEYLEESSPTTFFICIESEVDKRSKLFKQVNKDGRAVEFITPQEADLKKWIVMLLKKEGKQIRENTLNHFLSRSGTEMEQIRMEIEKLVCYCMDQDEITMEDVDVMIVPRIQNQIFDMITDISLKKQDAALNRYYQLLALKEPPMRILFLIARQFNLLMQVKELRRKGHDNRKIAEKTGLAPFLVTKYISQASAFKEKELYEALKDCVETEEKIKTGLIGEQIGLEMLIMRYSTK